MRLKRPAHHWIARHHGGRADLGGHPGCRKPASYCLGVQLGSAQFSASAACGRHGRHKRDSTGGDENYQSSHHADHAVPPACGWRLPLAGPFLQPPFGGG